STGALLIGAGGRYARTGVQLVSESAMNARARCLRISICVFICADFRAWRMSKGWSAKGRQEFVMAGGGRWDNARPRTSLTVAQYFRPKNVRQKRSAEDRFASVEALLRPHRRQIVKDLEGRHLSGNVDPGLFGTDEDVCVGLEQRRSIERSYA